MKDDREPLRFPKGTTLDACGPDGVAELARHWHETRVPAHTLILTEEETDDDVFFLLEGRARAATFTDRGREVFLSDVRAGEAFGIFAAIDGQPRSTNVVAVEDCRVGRMTGADFRKVLYGHGDVTRAFMIYMVDRIRSTSSRFTSVATLNAEQRLISELLRLAEGGRTGEDTAIIENLPTQQELAVLTFAAHREAVGRDMSRLKKAGLIERQGRSLLIRSLRGLRARLAGD
jgi:CRP-like cAMP-binding protein